MEFGDVDKPKLTYNYMLGLELFLLTRGKINKFKYGSLPTFFVIMVSVYNIKYIKLLTTKYNE